MSKNNDDSDDSQASCWRCKQAKKPGWNFCANCGTSFADTRAPSPANSTTDMPFLHDLYSFSWYNHHVASVVLYDAAVSIQRFYEEDIPEDYRLIVEPNRAQKILRIKIFAEYMAYLEAFGTLCLALEKRKEQSFMWTYLHTQPDEVAAFYDRVSSQQEPPTLSTLLALPDPAEIDKALAARSYEELSSLSEDEAQHIVDGAKSDYTAHIHNIITLAQMYRENDGLNVLIHNKIKDVFPAVEGQGWIHPQPDPHYIAIVLDDTGKIGRLGLGQEDIDRDLTNIRLTTVAGAELIALCLNLHLLGALY
jgi:hypothetical protein